MKTWEAVKALEEGRKVRRRGWNEDWYVLMDENGDFLDDCGTIYEFGSNSDDWEIYDDRYDVSQQLKDLYTLLDKLIEDEYDEYNEYLDKECADKECRRDYMLLFYKQLKEMNKYYKLDK